jgi:hypothetical protein
VFRVAASGWIIFGVLGGCGPQVVDDDGGGATEPGTGGSRGGGTAEGSATSGREPPAATTDTTETTAGDGMCSRRDCPPCDPGCSLDLGCTERGPSCECICGVEDGGSDSMQDSSGEPECPAGNEGCPCTDDDDCNPGFECDGNQNTCVVDVCPVGTEGCDCAPGRTCDPGIMCIDGICGMCIPGSEGCMCSFKLTCMMDLECIDGACVDPNGG